MMSAAVAGLRPIRPTGSYTNTRDVTRLRSQRIAERLSSGLGGGVATSRYRIAGRHSHAKLASKGGAAETIVIGRRHWVRQSSGSWRERVADLVDTRELMPWWSHRTGIRLLRLRAGSRSSIAEVALADIPSAGAPGTPSWFRLRIDASSARVLSMRMIAPAHFMNQRYHAFNAPLQIRPPIRRR